MTHVGEKHTLGVVCLFGLFFGLNVLAFEAFVLSHVLRQPNLSFDSARIAQHKGGRERDRDESVSPSTVTGSQTSATGSRYGAVKNEMGGFSDELRLAIA